MDSIKNVKNSNTNEIYNKLNLKIGKEFSAKIVSIDSKNNEAVLQLSNGLKLKADVKLNNKELLSNLKGLCRFKIIDCDNGKIKVVLTDFQGSKINSLKDYKDIFMMRGYNKEDFELLYSMIQHNIPLTNENISNIKSILYLKNILKNKEYSKEFINNFLLNKGIKEESKDFKIAYKSLSSYLKLLTSLEENDILFLYKNDISLSRENIQSYLKLINDDNYTLYKDFKDIKNKILSNKDNVEEGNINQNKNEMHKSSIDKTQIKVKVLNRTNDSFIKIKNTENNSIHNDNVKVQNAESNFHEDIQNNISENNVKIKDTESHTHKQDIEIKEESNSINSNNNKKNISLSNADENKEEITDKQYNKNGNNIDKHISYLDKNNKQTEVKGEIKEVLIKEIENSINQEIKNQKVKDQMHQNILKQNLNDDLHSIIKSDISRKINDIISSINLLLGEKNKLNSQLASHIGKILNNYGNDIKVYNTISNQYYYLNLPINIDKHEYEFKLIIKDNRKSGKKIDTKNVKIATSIKTLNLGTVDIYLTVSNHIMNIDIKCEKHYINVLDKNKNKLKKILDNGKYNIHVSVSQQVKQLSLSNCSSFFENTDLNSIDVFV